MAMGILTGLFIKVLRILFWCRAKEMLNFGRCLITGHGCKEYYWTWTKRTGLKTRVCHFLCDLRQVLYLWPQVPYVLMGITVPTLTGIDEIQRQEAKAFCNLPKQKWVFNIKEIIEFTEGIQTTVTKDSWSYIQPLSGEMMVGPALGIVYLEEQKGFGSCHQRTLHQTGETDIEHTRILINVLF